MDLAANYLDEIKRQLRGHKRLAESAMSQLNDQQFFTAIDPESNSVAIIVKHISGNAHSRFSDFLISDGESRIDCAIVNSRSIRPRRVPTSWTIGKRVGRSFSQRSTRSNRLTPNVSSPFGKSRTRSCRRLIALSLTTLNTLARLYFLPNTYGRHSGRR